MRSGIIRKTTSYIMGVPMNDMDINTPQMIYDRINSSDEFELKNISFDDKFSLSSREQEAFFGEDALLSLGIKKNIKEKVFKK